MKLAPSPLTAGPAVALGLALAIAWAAAAVAAEGPRILRKEVVVDAPLEDVWNAWTTEEGLTFISNESRVELRIGGPYEWFLDLEPDANGKRGGEGARILAFLPREVLAFTWTFPPTIPTLRNAGATTQVVVQFDALDDGRVRVRFAQHGWQDGEDWEAGYAYFDKAWDAVLQRLQQNVRRQQS